METETRFPHHGAGEITAAHLRVGDDVAPSAITGFVVVLELREQI
jgi:hypothetical protein